MLDNNAVAAPSAVLTPGMSLVDSALVATEVGDDRVAKFRDVVVFSVTPSLPPLVLVAVTAVMEIFDNNAVVAPCPVLRPGMSLVDSALVGTEVGDDRVTEFRDVVVVFSVTPSLPLLAAAVVEKLLDDSVVAVVVMSHPLHVLSHLSPTPAHKPVAKIL